MTNVRVLLKVACIALLGLVLTLPLYADIREEDVRRICDTIKGMVK